MGRIVIGVMGPGEGATEKDKTSAHELGTLIAKQGWVTLSGGRNSGVMDAVSKGAQEAGGLTIGIMPTKELDKISEGVDVSIITDMGSARNNINVLSSRVVIACGMGKGTASEVALALKSDVPVVLLNTTPSARDFFSGLGEQLVRVVESPTEAIEVSKELMN